nr:hypothetical protein Q903MT_gene5959 [Picea sitchensis]
MPILSNKTFSLVPWIPHPQSAPHKTRFIKITKPNSKFLFYLVHPKLCLLPTLLLQMVISVSLN